VSRRHAALDDNRDTVGRVRGASVRQIEVRANEKGRRPAKRRSRLN
jgi:hypothetical protein